MKRNHVKSTVEAWFQPFFITNLKYVMQQEILTKDFFISFKYCTMINLSATTSPLVSRLTISSDSNRLWNVSSSQDSENFPNPPDNGQHYFVASKLEQPFSAGENIFVQWHWSQVILW